MSINVVYKNSIFWDQYVHEENAFLNTLKFKKTVDNNFNIHSI